MTEKHSFSARQTNAGRQSFRLGKPARDATFFRLARRQEQEQNCLFAEVPADPEATTPATPTYNAGPAIEFLVDVAAACLTLR